jgi:membrane protein
MLSQIIQCYKNALIDTINHDGVEHGGYIAFLCMLSIFPFFIFFAASIAIIGNLYLENIKGESILNIITSLLVESNFANLIEALKPRIIEITSTPPQPFLSLAIVSVIWTASSLLEGLRTILNRAYRVSKPPNYLLRRLLSIMQFILISFLVMVLIFIIKILPIISEGLLFFMEDFRKYSFITRGLNIIIELKESLNWLIVFGINFLLLSSIYYLIPNKKQKFIETFPGTFNTIIWWQISTNAFQDYLSIFKQINIVYGSIAGIIIALLYFYICSLVFIYGAELNYWFQKLVFKANYPTLDKVL